MTRLRNELTRVEEARRSLRCEACGSGNDLEGYAREHGWIRCSHCDTPLTTPGAGEFIVEEPEGRATRRVRPGSSDFETAQDFVFPFRWGLLILVFAELCVESAAELSSRFALAGGPGLSAPVLAVLVLGAGLVHLGSVTRQRLSVREDLVELCWVTWGRAWRRRSMPTQRFRTDAHLTGRTGVALRSPGRRLFVRMRGRHSVRWLESEIGAAVVDARTPEGAERVACGGPVATEQALARRGAIECPHCSTGLVETGGGIAMPPAKIAHDLTVPADAPAPDVSEQAGTLRWLVPAWSSRRPIASVLNALGIVALQGGMFWLLARGIAWLPALNVVAAMCALVPCYGSLKITGSAAFWLFGRHEIGLDATTLQLRSFIGPWARRPRSIPLSRLLSVETRTEQSEIILHAKTATSDVELGIYGLEHAPVVRDVVEALPARLEALGRSSSAATHPAPPGRQAPRGRPLPRIRILKARQA